MNPSNSAGRFRAARPLVLPATLLCAAFSSRAAYCQIDPVKNSAPQNSAAPSGTDRTIVLTEGVDPARYRFPDEDPPYRVDRSRLFGEPRLPNRSIVGSFPEPVTIFTIAVPAVQWNEETVLRHLDLDPALLEPGGSPKTETADRARRTSGKRKLLKAAQSLAIRDAEGALTLLKEAAKDLPGLPAPALLAARLARHVDDDDFRRGAGLLMDELAINDSHSPEWAIDAAATALDDGRLGDAMALLDRYRLKLNESASWWGWSPAHRSHVQARAYAIEVEVHRRTRKWTNVVHVAQLWLAIEPGATAAFTAIGEATYARGPKDSADQDAALGSFERAYCEFRTSRKIPSESPGLPPPELQMADVAERYGDDATAAKWIDKLREKLPSYGRDDPQEQVRCGLLMARRLLDRGDAAGARQAYLAVKANEATDLPSRRFGVELACLERSTDSVGLLTRLHRDFPNDETAAGLMAAELANSDAAVDRSRAVEIAESNHERHPKSASARCTLGWAYYRSGRQAEADRQIERVIDATGGSIPAGLTPDDIYLMAKILFDEKSTLGRRTFAIRLLGDATRSPRPFRNRKQAEAWLKQFTG